MVKEMDNLVSSVPVWYSPTDGMLYGTAGIHNSAIVRMSGLAKPASEVKSLLNTTVATSMADNKTVAMDINTSIPQATQEPKREVSNHIWICFASVMTLCAGCHWINRPHGI